MSLNKGIYIVKFETKDDMNSFLKKKIAGVSVRCIFNAKKSISIFADKKALLQIINEGFTPEYISPL